MTSQPSHLVFFAWFSLIAVSAHAQDAAVYSDGSRGEVTFPQGVRSFADEVVMFEAGEPNAGPISARPQVTVGPPDYDEARDANYLTLGCAGRLVLAFADNSLIDIPGPDLYIFEIGPQVEATGLAISEDGANWIRVGKITGGTSAVDIAPFAEPGATYRYVRLVDMKQSCKDYPGADIDAVGAIGSARTITLDSAVLFDTGKHELKAASTQALSEVAGELKLYTNVEATVSGHTDSVGSESDNRLLAHNRAQAVANFLSASPGLEDLEATTQSFGESRPIASNATPAGRQRNRRVEITVTTAERSFTDVQPTEILGIWDSSEGMLQLQTEGTEVSGEYGQNDGKIVGTFSGDTEFSGYWIQPS